MDVIEERGYTEGIPHFDALTVTVPGAAAAWTDVVSKFGSGKLSMSEVSTWSCTGFWATVHGTPEVASWSDREYLLAQRLQTWGDGMMLWGDGMMLWGDGM
eukprot:2758213-Pyramimonas_sp.AAC.1